MNLLYKLQKYSKISYPILAIILFITLNIVNIIYYLQAAYVPGWDGIGHVAYAYVYGNNIFPKLFGYLDVWFNGVPFPNFYPPLFYIITSFLRFIGDQNDFLFNFKLFNILILILTVLLYYIFSNTIFKNRNLAFVSTVILICILSTYRKIGDLGISVESVFNYGFLPQSFAFIFFLIFLILSIGHTDIKNRIFYILSLLFIALSNIHVLITTIIYIFIYLYILYKENKLNELKIRIIDTFISGSLSLFWYLPMIFYIQYSAAKSSDYGGEYFTKYILFIIIITSIFSLYSSNKYKDLYIKIISIYSLTLGIFNIFPITQYITVLPLHVKRWLITPIVLLPVLLIYCIKSNKNKYIKIIFTVFVFSLLFIYINSIKNQNQDSYFTSYKSDNFQELIDWLKVNKNNQDTLINVESVYLNNVADFWYIHALLGMNNVNTTYSILRESASTSFVFAQIRNSISMTQESIAVKTNVMNQNIKHNYFINQAIDLGVTDFLVKSDFSKKILSKNKNVYLEHKFKDWYIFKVKNPSNRIMDRDLRVIRTYGDFNLKKNTDDMFDLTRLSEELIWSDKLDLIFYLDDEQDLSKMNRSEDISAIFISKFKYSNIDTAYNNIIDISKNRPVFVIKDYDNNLFDRLYKLKNKNENIHFIDNKYYTINTDRYHLYYKYIFNFIDNRIENKTNDFIYIKKTYFPNPQSTHKQYIATPFYTLESKKISMEHSIWNIYVVSKIITVSTLLISILYFIYIYRYNHSRK